MSSVTSYLKLVGEVAYRVKLHMALALKSADTITENDETTPRLDIETTVLRTSSRGVGNPLTLAPLDRVLPSVASEFDP